MAADPHLMFVVSGDLSKQFIVTAVCPKGGLSYLRHL